MTATLDAVTKKNKPEPTAEERVAEELVRRAREEGLSLTGVDEMVLSLYAEGLTTGEFSAHFAEIYGASVSKETISRSRHCLAGGRLQACSGATTRRSFYSFDSYWPGRRDGARMPGASKAALSIGLSLPDGHLVRNAA